MTSTRAYDNSGRQLAARETRARIVAAGRSLLLAGGYPAMTVASLAEAAGVSPQTVYNSVGGKTEVVKAVYDVMLVGDDKPVPMSSRPEFLAMMAAPDRAAFLNGYARVARMVHERVGPLLGVLLAHGPGGDDSLEAFVTTIDRERRIGNGHMLTALKKLHGLPAGVGPTYAADVVWTLTAPEVADRLIRRCNWTAAKYERWLGGMLTAALG